MRNFVNAINVCSNHLVLNGTSKPCRTLKTSAEHTTCDDFTMADALLKFSTGSIIYMKYMFSV